LLLALDDSINPKTGRKIFACQHFLRITSPRPIRLRYPWSQNIVTIGLLKVIHRRWSCLPLAFWFYFLRKTVTERTVRMGRQALAEASHEAPMLVVTDA
jgi:hypothetical protein